MDTMKVSQYFSGSRNPDIYIENVAHVKIELPNGAKFTLSVEDGKLSLRSDDSILIKPVAANSVRISQDNWKV